MSYIYEDAIDFIEESSQLNFIQESIDVMGINEGFSPKETLKKAWEKVKSAFDWIRRKIKELIEWVKGKFKKKDKEAETIVKDIENKANNPKKVEQATTALAVIAKPSTNTSSQVPVSKINGLSAAGGKFTYEKLNDSVADKISGMLREDVKSIIDLNNEMTVDNIGKKAVQIANDKDTFSKKAFDGAAKSIEDTKSEAENLLSTLVTKISISKVDIAVTRDIYDSYLSCSKKLEDWSKISGTYEKTVGELTNKFDKVMKTITSHATSSDSDDAEREVLKNLQGVLSIINKSVQLSYDVAIKTYNTINSVKNSNYAALFMIYRAYRKGEGGSSNQSNYNGSSSNNNPRLGTTAVVAR